MKEIEVYVPFTYINYNVNSYGMIKASAKGYDMAEVASVGFIEFKDGMGDSPVLKSDNSNYSLMKNSIATETI